MRVQLWTIGILLSTGLVACSNEAEKQETPSATTESATISPAVEQPEESVESGDAGPTEPVMPTCTAEQKLNADETACEAKVAADWTLAADCTSRGYYWYDDKDVTAATAEEFAALKPSCRASALDACPSTGSLKWAKKSGALVEDAVSSTTLSRSNQGITELYTTLRCFAAMTDLSLGGNQLTSFDGHLVPNLKDLNLYYNPNLAALDVRRNTKLEDLSAQYGKFTSLDLSQNTALKNLNINYGKLSSLDLSALAELIDVSAAGLQDLKTLDVTKNTKLTSIDVSGSALTSLDLSKQASPMQEISIGYTGINPSTLGANTTQLQYLDLSGLDLTSLPFSLPTTLRTLSLSGNQITSVNVQPLANLWFLDVADLGLNSLDVSSNTNLIYLFASGNNLTSINLSSNTQLNSADLSDNDLTYDYDGTTGTRLDLSTLSELRELYLQGNANFDLHFGANTFHSNYLASSDSMLMIEQAKWTAATGGSKPAWSGEAYGSYYLYSAP